MSPQIPNLAIKLKALRLLHRIHQRDFAQSIGVPHNLMVEYEKGRAYPGPDQFSAIEDTLGIKFDDATENAFATLAPNLQGVDPN